MAKKKRRRLVFDILEDLITGRKYYQKNKFRDIRHLKGIQILDTKGIRHWSDYI